MALKTAFSNQVENVCLGMQKTKSIKPSDTV